MVNMVRLAELDADAWPHGVMAQPSQVPAVFQLYSVFTSSSSATLLHYLYARWITH
jgi:hypothetical protein